MSDEFAYDDDPIEGYCMSDREMVEMEEPVAVWTRKGQPATRGVCPICGGTVFRLGKTHMHAKLQRPEPVVIGDKGDKRTRPKLARDTVYLNYSDTDEEVAQKIALDLEKSGIAVWLHESGEHVSWSSGVHPALKECTHMLLVLSEAALGDAEVQTAWEFFRDNRKPIIIAQIAAVDPPDRIRRSPRYDFAAEYKPALRQTVLAIAS